ncbi:MAG: glycosyltransferase family 4 protein [Actinomycetota bacterium]|nr:glycosyltransferase family 4 protein [Actinomycetota bacterium]
MRLKGPLERRGVETVVILPQEAGDAAARLRVEGVDVAQMPMRRLRATADPRVQLHFLATLRKDLNRLSALIADRGIDVVQVHGATNPQGAIAARKQGAAVVWQLFDTRAPMVLRRMAMPLVVGLADAMTVWGRELVRVHPGAERLGERLTTVYPPVDPAEFAPASSASRDEARAELGVPPDAELVGSVGVLNPQKGHEHLIRAAELVREQHENVYFRVLGGASPAHATYERSLRNELEARGLADRFEFVDPKDSVARLMQAFDVFAMTSVPRSEGMPTVILEAMMCGKPVVTTDVGAVRELVEIGVSGLVVEPLRPELIAAALGRLLGDEKLRERIGEAARSRAQSEFSLDRLADRHVAAYRQAIDHRRKRLEAYGRSRHPA